MLCEKKKYMQFSYQINSPLFTTFHSFVFLLYNHVFSFILVSIWFVKRERHKQTIHSQKMQQRILKFKHYFIYNSFQIFYSSYCDLLRVLISYTRVNIRRKHAFISGWSRVFFRRHTCVVDIVCVSERII